MVGLKVPNSGVMRVGSTVEMRADKTAVEMVGLKAQKMAAMRVDLMEQTMAEHLVRWMVD